MLILFTYVFEKGPSGTGRVPPSLRLAIPVPPVPRKMGPSLRPTLVKTCTLRTFADDSHDKLKQLIDDYLRVIDQGVQKCERRF